MKIRINVVKLNIVFFAILIVISFSVGAEYYTGGVKNIEIMTLAINL